MSLESDLIAIFTGGAITATEAAVLIAAAIEANPTGGQDPDLVRSVVVDLGPSEIVGSGAGSLGHAGGVTFIPGVPGKLIFVLWWVAEFTFSTASYGGTGTVVCNYDGGVLLTAAGSLGSTLINTSSNRVGLAPNSSTSLLTKTGAPVGEGVILRTASAFTNPGTAAGTLRVKAFYRLLDMG